MALAGIIAPPSTPDSPNLRASPRAWPSLLVVIVRQAVEKPHLKGSVHRAAVGEEGPRAILRPMRSATWAFLVLSGVSARPPGRRSATVGAPSHASGAAASGSGPSR